ncbi:Transducin/WD40 repeat-like superfamily protein [Abeliophyllum distichum]|uniref:Transducin/WD40 repeat-like superfamily protein n=1 Tax=Abeliophyllum distichum TaxID=126358 RepID=A0ABD1SEV0_9LAMI
MYRDFTPAGFWLCLKESKRQPLMNMKMNFVTESVLVRPLRGINEICSSALFVAVGSTPPHLTLFDGLGLLERFLCSLYVVPCWVAIGASGIKKLLTFSESDHTFSCRCSAMQGGSTGVGYGLKYQARCISDVKADTDHTSFLTGTLSLKEENEVHLIRLSSGGTELICEGLFSHPNEIWDLASCPFDQRIFSTVFSSGESYGAAIWQIPELYGQLNSPQLERIASLDAHSSKIKCVLWWPTGRHDKLVSIDEQNLFLWSIDTSKKTAQVQSQQSAGMLHYLSGGAWDAHDVNAVALTCESSVQLWDLRTMKTTNSIQHAHVRNVDYDTKNKYMLVTAEDESGIHIWDLRKPKFPVSELPGHSHWTWTVKCNPEYEGLILSAGTDSAVNLWLVPPSSDDSALDSLLESPTRRVDPLLHSYTDYEDSVYDLAWSSREPWIFASLSYDGRVVVESIKPHHPKK